MMTNLGHLSQYLSSITAVKRISLTWIICMPLSAARYIRITSLLQCYGNGTIQQCKTKLILLTLPFISAAFVSGCPDFVSTTLHLDLLGSQWINRLEVFFFFFSFSNQGISVDFASTLRAKSWRMKGNTSHCVDFTDSSDEALGLKIALGCLWF